MIEAEILREAAALIRGTGKTAQGSTDEDGRMCAVIAINRAITAKQGYAQRNWIRKSSFQLYDATLSATEETIKELGYLSAHRGGLVPVAYWSDYVAKDAEDVAVVFEKTAARLEEKQGL